MLLKAGESVSSRNIPQIPELVLYNCYIQIYGCSIGYCQIIVFVCQSVWRSAYGAFLAYWLPLSDCASVQADRCKYGYNVSFPILEFVVHLPVCLSGCSCFISLSASDQAMGVPLNCKVRPTGVQDIRDIEIYHSETRPTSHKFWLWQSGAKAVPENSLGCWADDSSLQFHWPYALMKDRWSGPYESGQGYAGMSRLQWSSCDEHTLSLARQIYWFKRRMTLRADFLTDVSYFPVIWNLIISDSNRIYSSM